MLEEIKFKTTGILYAGEHRAKDIIIEGLERIPGAKYFLAVQSTGNKCYEIKLPDDAENIPIDGTMIPVAGILKVMLIYKTAADDVVEKSETAKFEVKDALITDGEALPDYKTLKSIAEEVLSVPEQIEEFVGTVEYVREVGDIAFLNAIRAEQVADGSVPNDIVSGIKIANAVTNLFQPGNYTLGETIPDISGVIEENPEFMLTGYIPCTPGSQYYYPGGNRRRGIWYNADKDVIAYENYGTWPEAAGMINAPMGAAFLRLSYGITPYDGVAGCDLEHFMLVYGGNSYPKKYMPCGTFVDWLHTSEDALDRNRVWKKEISNKGVVTIFAESGSPLEISCKVVTQETLPESGDKSADNPSTFLGLNSITVTVGDKNYTFSLPSTAWGFPGFEDVVDLNSGQLIHNTGHIPGYNGEEIGDVYLSSTGGLDIGAEVVYPLAEPTTEPITGIEKIYSVTHADKYTPEPTAVTCECAELTVGYAANLNALIGNGAPKIPEHITNYIEAPALIMNPEDYINSEYADSGIEVEEVMTVSEMEVE